MKKFQACFRGGVYILLLFLLLTVTGCDNVSNEADDHNASTTATTDMVTTTQSASSVVGNINATTLYTSAVSSHTTAMSTDTTGTTGSDATTITFRENANVRVRFDEDTLVYPANFDGYMVHNKAEYDALRLETLEMHAPSHSKEYEPLDLTPYTEDYFTDKALVVLYLSSGAGNVQLHVDDLTVRDMCFLTVSYTEETPTVTTLESSNWCILLEVEAASVEKITDVVGEKTKVILP